MSVSVRGAVGHGWSRAMQTGWITGGEVESLPEGLDSAAHRRLTGYFQTGLVALGPQRHLAIPGVPDIAYTGGGGGGGGRQGQGMEPALRFKTGQRGGVTALDPAVLVGPEAGALFRVQLCAVRRQRVEPGQFAIKRRELYVRANQFLGFACGSGAVETRDCGGAVCAAAE